MSGMRNEIRFLHRGRAVACHLPHPDITLLDWLRVQQRLTGTKEGCNEGDCGACTVVLGRLEQGRLVRRAVNACITLLGQVDGAELITVEDLARGGTLHPVQSAMVTHHGSQCGFCTPGIVMSLLALTHDKPLPLTREAINERLAGNLCRCTGYRPIVDAAMELCSQPMHDQFTAATGDVIAALAALDDGVDVMAGDEAQFFAAPATLASATALASRVPNATLLAGASDVGLWVTKRLQPLRRIIWLGRIKDMRGIAADGDGLRMGACVRLGEAWAHLAAIDPDLGALMQRFASTQIRNSATIGGNIANGSPIGDLAPALIALGATIELQLGDIVRRLPLERFFVAYGRQDRAPGEILTAITIPRLSPDERFRCFKVSKRVDEDISAVMGAFHVTIANGRIAGARFAYGGMAGVPQRAAAAEQALTGLNLDDEQGLRAGADRLAQDFLPLSDMRASAAYRLDVAKALLLRALDEMAGRRGDSDRLIGRRNRPRRAEAPA